MNAFAFQSLEPRRLFAATISFTNGQLVVTGTEGPDNFYLDTAPANVDGGPGIVVRQNGDVVRSIRADKIRSILLDGRGGKDSVFISGDVKIPKVNGKDVPVTLRGGNGDDDVSDFRPNAKNCLVDGQGGNDFLLGSDTIRGGSGNDAISGGDAAIDDSRRGTANYIDAGDGNDTIYGSGGSDTIYAQGGDDKIRTIWSANPDGSPGYSVIDAGSGNDSVEMKAAGTVHLGAGNDRLDFLYYYIPASPINGGDFYGDAGDDYLTMRYNETPNAKRVFTLHGGDGRDVLSGDSTKYAVERMYGDAGDDDLYGGSGSDYLYGGSGKDKIDGNYGNDRVYGGDDDDFLGGGPGYDYLYGEKGNDLLYGNGDNDTLDGGSGRDQFYGNAGRDTINAKDNEIDTIFGTESGDVLNRDSFDVLKAS